MADSGQSTILTLLRDAGDEWVSGEELSRRMGVSRTAVWKQIEGLRAAGYVLEAQPRMGYRLVSTPDIVTPLEILPGLTTRRFGRQVEYRESVGSTNDLAKQLARRGAAEGLLVIADEQTAGRGRMGRVWRTPPGSNVAMSLVLRPDLPLHQAPRITIAAAVGAAEAVREVTGLNAGIKWPNDLYVSGRKVCGILTEMEAEVDQVAFVVVGIGINVNQPQEQIDPAIRDMATSLMVEKGERIARAPLVQAVLAKFEAAYDDLLSARFEQVLDRWRDMSITLGKHVRVIVPGGESWLDGVAEDVDEDGALLLRTEGGVLHRVIAGEVSIRPY